MTPRRKARIANWCVAICALGTLATAIPMVARGMQQPAPHDTWLEIIGVTLGLGTLISAVASAVLWQPHIARHTPQWVTVWRQSEADTRAEIDARTITLEPVQVPQLPAA